MSLLEKISKKLLLKIQWLDTKIPIMGKRLIDNHF
jgi:hypothetical protein